jgi:hypothetical protein
MKFFKTAFCLASALVFLAACSKSDSTPEKTLITKWFFASESVLNHYNNTFNNSPMSGNSYLELKSNKQFYISLSEPNKPSSTATGTWTQVDATHLQLTVSSATGNVDPTLTFPYSTNFTILTFTSSALVLQYQETSASSGRLYTYTDYFTR